MYIIYLTFSHSSHLGVVSCVQYVLPPVISAVLVSFFSHVRSNNNNQEFDVSRELQILLRPAASVFRFPLSVLRSAFLLPPFSLPLDLSQNNMELPFFVCPKILFHISPRSHSEKGERIFRFVPLICVEGETHYQTRNSRRVNHPSDDKVQGQE